MNHDGLRRMAAWPLLIATACILLLAGCQDSSGPGVVAAPDVKSAPEGKKPQPQPPADPAIAFVDDERVQGQDFSCLKVMNTDGSNETTIYSTPGQLKLSYKPSWSPDGGSIVFPCNYDLWLVDVSVIGGIPTGLNPRVLLDRSTLLSYPAWSPDGEQIAFVDLELGTLETVPAAGGEPSVLYTCVSGQPTYPTWSYDGTRIAFRGDGAVRIMDVDTKEVTTVPEEGGGFLDWARTQDALAFGVGWVRGHNLEIYTMQLPDGSPTLILEGVMWPTWSPDDSEILVFDPRGTGFETVNVITHEITRLGVSGKWPDWGRF